MQGTLTRRAQASAIPNFFIGNIPPVTTFSDVSIGVSQSYTEISTGVNQTYTNLTTGVSQSYTEVTPNPSNTWIEELG